MIHDNGLNKVNKSLVRFLGSDVNLKIMLNIYIEMRMKKKNSDRTIKNDEIIRGQQELLSLIL